MSDVNNCELPLISVVIPTYNRHDVIGYALKSALSQTYPNKEIIVVDDGSTDATRDYVKSFNGNIRYAYKTNGGVSSARNLGSELSSGSFIAFLDSDDEWFPEKLEKQMRYFTKNPDYGMVLCDSYFIDSSRKRVGETLRRKTLPKDGFILDDVIMSPYLIPSSVLIKKIALEDVGYFDETIKTAEDLDLHLKIASRYKIGLIDEYLLNCMSGHEGLSMLSRSYDDHIFVINRFIVNNIIKSNIKKRALFETYLGASNGKFWQNEWRNGAFNLLKSATYISSLEDVRKLSYMILKGFKYFIKKQIMSNSSETPL